jgi:hypothetical protein
MTTFPAVSLDSTNDRVHRLDLANAIRAVQKFLTSRIASAGQPITLGGLITVPHGFNASPFNVALDLQCIAVVGEGGWAQNNICQNVSGAGFVYSDSMNVYVRVAPSIALGRKDTGVSFTLTPANWNLIVKAVL